MSAVIHLYIEGKAVAKQRPRLGRGNSVYTPQKTKDYEAMVATIARQKLPGFSPLTGPVLVDISVFVKIPKSWSKKNRRLADDGYLYPTRGDVDNYAKSICDGMNGIVYADDSQIVNLRIDKKYSEIEGVCIEVHPEQECALA